MLSVFDTAQERDTAARRQVRTEDPERRSKEQVDLLGLCLSVCLITIRSVTLLLLKDGYIMMIQNKEK